MKFINLATLAQLSYQILAGHNETDSSLEAIAMLIEDEPDPKKFLGIVDMMVGVTTTKYSRKALSSFIKDYGCHCFTQDPLTKATIVGGKGAPVDAQDTLCKKLAQCHACVAQDYNFKKKCDPDVGNYRYNVDPVLKAISCQGNNDPCKRNACECDKHFALQFATIWDDSKFNRYFWRNKHNVKAGNPVFDKDGTCKATGYNFPKDECCGNYPRRKPYSSVLYECCMDGSVKSLGSC